MEEVSGNACFQECFRSDIFATGYVTGNSISSDGSSFTQYAQGNIVWVSIQYRLGGYGFLSPDEFDGLDAVKNAGLLDQRFALEWVQRHIASFGGDPSKVTIWGGSAGGGSVANQLIYQGGEEKPPYRAAIAGMPLTRSLLLAYRNSGIY